MDELITRRSALGIIGGGLTSLLLPSCVTQSVKKTTNYGFIERKGKLEVGRDDKNHFYWRKSREEGERDLVDLARSSFIEGEFAFIDGLNLWVEIGNNETPYNLKTNLYYIFPYRGLSLSQYHVHPLTPFYELLELFTGGFFSDRHLFDFISTARNYPSPIDLFNSNLSPPYQLEVFKLRSRVFRDFKSYNMVVVDHIGTINYTPFFDLSLDLLSLNLGGQNDENVLRALTQSYGATIDLYLTFLERDFISNFMNRLPESGRFKTTEVDFNISFEDFKKRLSDYRKSTDYTKLEFNLDTALRIKESRKLNQKHRLNVFNDFLDQNLAGIIK